MDIYLINIKKRQFVISRESEKFIDEFHKIEYLGAVALDNIKFNKSAGDNIFMSKLVDV